MYADQDKKVKFITFPNIIGSNYNNNSEYLGNTGWWVGNKKLVIHNNNNRRYITWDGIPNWAQQIFFTALYRSSLRFGNIITRSCKLLLVWTTLLTASIKLPGYPSLTSNSFGLNIFMLKSFPQLESSL